MTRYIAFIILIIILSCKKQSSPPYTPRTYPVYSNPSIHKIIGYRLFTVNGEIVNTPVVEKYSNEFSAYFYTSSSAFNNLNIKKYAVVNEDSLWNLGTVPVGEMKRKTTGEYDTYRSREWWPVNDTNNIVLHLMKYKMFEKAQTPSGLSYLKYATPNCVLKRIGDTLLLPLTKFILISRTSNTVVFSSDHFNNDIDPTAYTKLGMSDTLLLQRFNVALFKEK